MEITGHAWCDFLKNIADAKQAIGNPDVVWYRGHTIADRYLLPSLLRYKNGIDKEKYLFDTYKKFSDKIFPRRDSDWETLFEMQHYGIPTRLLDWSETFGVALFFAAGPYYKNGDAAMYLLNPKKLNKISNIQKVYYIPEDEDTFAYKTVYWEHKPFSPQAPIAVEPILINERMKAQRGMFTVHNDNIDPIEDLYPECVQKIILKENAINAAKEFLDLSNLTPLTVYPDQGGLSDFLKTQSNLVSRW